MVVECFACHQQNRVPTARLTDKARCAACKGNLAPLDAPLPIASSSEFDELVQNARVPVLVDFWAEWCGPCRALSPELTKLAKQRTGRLVVAKVDSDAHPEVAARFGIRSIPTMVVFRDGHEAKRVSGAMSASTIASSLSV